MKFPHWMVVDSIKRTKDGDIITFRVRRWHPGYWWFVAKVLVVHWITGK